MQPISRNRDETSESKIVAMVTMVLSIPRLVEQVDAFLVFPGMGEWWRVNDAAALWNTHKNARHLLIAGHNQRENTARKMDLAWLMEEFELNRKEGVVCISHAEHTKDQCDWVAEQVRELHLTSLALCVSPYHIVRAYLTLLKTLHNTGIRIPIVPFPVQVSPSEEIPETGTDAWSMVAGEVERIHAYQQKGDVASSELLHDYLAWFWKGDHALRTFRSYLTFKHP